MGRLNYTNRKSEGVKLGQAKRIPPASGSKAAQRDPVVEIDISSKSLTDRGFFELAKALIESILYSGEHGRVVRLEELCLKDNHLTPVSLDYLSRVVQLACNDLRDLDLSNNDICINTPEDIAAWEHFLGCFSECCVLRRLDLSCNNLGPKAYEVFTRVYSTEQPVEIVLPEDLACSGHEEVRPSTGLPRGPNGLEHKMRKMSILPEADDPAGHDVEEVGPPLGKHKGTRHGFKPAERSGTSAAEADKYPLYATAKGLRSIPYIVLSDTSMDETSALHLSYILANHQPPNRLLARVPPAKAGPHAQQLLAYDNETRCRGIIYLPNPTLSNAAQKVLEIAETVRDGIQDTATPSSGDERGAEKQVPSGTNEETYHITGHRRRSSINIDEETHQSMASDLDRARSRLQGNAIERAGHRSNDLWRVALKMLAISRDIRHQTRNTSPPRPEPLKTKPQIIRTLEIPGVVAKKANVGGVPLAPKSSNQTMSPRPNRPHKDSNSITPVFDMAGSVRTKSCTRAELCTIPGFNKEYRSKLPKGFSEDVWWQILGYAAGANGLLSDGQQKSVLRYAMDRGTMRKERDSLGLKEAAQIWHVLEGMDCLAYEMR
ncbi:MAG: hypothetical protein Q9163_000838 [Psora crenata]